MPAGPPPRLLSRIPPDARRFLLAGGTAAAANWLARFPLSAVMPFPAAVAAAYLVGMAVGFALYRAWVFPGSPLPLRAQAARFLAVNAVGAAVVLAASSALAGALAAAGLAPGPARALAHGLAIGLGAVLSFSGHRLVTVAGRGARA